jgi:hypothetical protein
MQMLDKLTGRAAVIAQYIVPIRIRTGSHSSYDFSQTGTNLAQKLGWTIMQLPIMLSGNNQSVTIGHRANIQKSNDNLVFVNLGNRNLTAYYPAEDTIVLTHS